MRLDEIPFKVDRNSPRHTRYGFRWNENQGLVGGSLSIWTNNDRTLFWIVRWYELTTGNNKRWEHLDALTAQCILNTLLAEREVTSEVTNGTT